MTTFDQRGQTVGQQINVEPTVKQFAGSEEYGASYYGMMLPAKANYIGYAPSSSPHWAMPLASWLKEHFGGPYLDVGCAYGHLVRDLIRFGCAANGIDWSPWASSRFVSDACIRADARDIPYSPRSFGTVVSLDLLEHFDEDNTRRVLREMRNMLKPKGWMVHLVGARNADDDTNKHMSDPTHANHQPLDWYKSEIRKLGFRIDDNATYEISINPAWASTDWRNRFIVAQSVK